MGTNNKKKRVDKKRKKRTLQFKHGNTNVRAISTGYQFIHTFPITVSEAVGFPGLFRDVRMTYAPKEHVISSTDLTGLEFELLMYKSIDDRTCNINPFVSLIANIKKSYFLSSKDKSFISSSQFISPATLRTSDFCVWRLEIELVELIEPASLYGEWHALQGDDYAGLVNISLDVDICIARVPLGSIGTQEKSDSIEEAEYFQVEKFDFSEESRSLMGQLSRIQVDAAWFIMVGISASIPGLSAPSPLLSHVFESSQAERESLLRKLNQYEDSLMQKLRSVTSEARVCRCEVESLVNINYQRDPNTRRYNRCKDDLVNLISEFENNQKYIVELRNNLEVSENELSRLEELKIKSIRNVDVEQFQHLTIKISDLNASIQSCTGSLDDLMLQNKNAPKVIERKKSEIRLLESRLGIANLIKNIQELREQEVSLMTEIDRCLMERIYLMSGYNAWAQLNKRPMLNG